MYYSEGDNSKGGYYKPANDDDTFLKVNNDNENNFEVISNQNNENNDNNEGYIQTKMTLDNNDSKQGRVRKKVTQACENCRKKRRKCTGERPKCLTCLQYNYVCYYNPFPKKRGPQQKREKRKYKKREKSNVNSDSSILELKDEGLYNLKLIENQFKRSTKLNDVNITQSIYNNVLAYKTSVHQKYKLNVNETPVIESELINYSVIDCYYKYFHPNYPILFYTTFTNYIKNDSLSKYLLFAMYGMAYLFQPKPNIQIATEYIEKAKSLIFQNCGLNNVQLLQALFLITVFESGTSQSWLFSNIATRIIKDNYIYFLNQTNNNKDLYIEDREAMRAISLAFYGYDTWNNIMFKDRTEKQFKHDIQSFINRRSNYLITLTSELSSTNYEYFVMSISLLLLELLHIDEKMNENDFSIEDIDSVNTDIIKIQKYFFKEIEDITLKKFNDIAEDFSYYQDLSEILEDEEYMKNNPLTKINSISIINKNDNNNINISKNSFLDNNYNSNNNTNNCRDEFSKDPFIGVTDGRQIYSEILKRISQDELLFSRKFKLLSTRISKIQTVFDMQKSIMISLNSFSKCKFWMKFFMITGTQRIYLNRKYAQYVIKHPGKIKMYPIAKSIAVACKTADDNTIGLMLLLEAAENSNNLPIRFSFGKSWVFYQCCVIYILRYVATQERKHIKYYSRESIKYSSFSSYPQETLAPCYFYLDLLKQMRNYFPYVQNYIREIKILISQAENAVKNKTFNININEFII